MAQHSGLRGGLWITGRPGTFSTSSRSVRRIERYQELKELEQDSRKRAKEMQGLELEICDLSGIFEKLTKRDAQRLQRISELAKLFGANDEAHSPSSGNIGGVRHLERASVKQTPGDLYEQLVRLKHDHAAAQSQLYNTRVTLEQKQTELETLLSEYSAFNDLITKEEKILQAAEVEEPLQQTVAVQHEMKSLWDDLGRLGRLMEGLEGLSNVNQQARSLAHSQKQRVYHRVTSMRSTRFSRKFQHGVASDQGRPLTSVEDALPLRCEEPIRSKEPIEFEEEGSGNRKRQKSTTYEIEPERRHHQRGRPELEAKERRILVESCEASNGASSQTPQPILSPESGFGELEVVLPVVPRAVSSVRTDSNSISSKFSPKLFLEKLNEGFLASVSDPEHPDLQPAEVVQGFLQDTFINSASEKPFRESSSECEQEIIREDPFGVQVVKVDFSSTVSQRVGEEVFATDSETEQDIQRSVEENDSYNLGEGHNEEAPQEEVERTTKELNSLADTREADRVGEKVITTPGNGVKEGVVATTEDGVDVEVVTTMHGRVEEEVIAPTGNRMREQVVTGTGNGEEERITTTENGVKQKVKGFEGSETAEETEMAELCVIRVGPGAVEVMRLPKNKTGNTRDVGEAVNSERLSLEGSFQLRQAKRNCLKADKTRSQDSSAAEWRRTKRLLGSLWSSKNIYWLINSGRQRS